MEQTKLKEYKNNFVEYVGIFKSKRIRLYDKAYKAYLLEKSESKKLCTILGREIFEEDKFYEEDIIFKGELRDNLIELVNIGIKNDLDLEELIHRLCDLSPIIDFIFKFSELCHKLFDDLRTYELFIILFFQKNYIPNNFTKFEKIGIQSKLKNLSFISLINNIKMTYKKGNSIIEEAKKIFEIKQLLSNFTEKVNNLNNNKTTRMIAKTEENKNKIINPILKENKENNNSSTV